MVAGAATLLLGGCGSAHAEPVAVTLDEHDNGQTVHVAVGADVTVTLHSTYWTFSPVPAGVLKTVGAPATVGGACAPGEGCGTVTVRFTAVGKGTAALAAGRTTCGEALACGPGQGTYRVTVDVDKG